MSAKMFLLAFLAACWAVGALGADRNDAEAVLKKYQSIRPTSTDLAIYSLDWAPTLNAALKKAAREERPILLVVVTNSFGNITSGHC
jgi:hypothetical protein